MARKKVSELPNCAGKDLMLAAEKRGLEIFPITGWNDDATPVILIGLCDILAQNDIGGINEIVAKMEKAK